MTKRALSLAICSLLTSVIACAATAKFSGEVSRGRDFQRQLSKGMFFCLFSVIDGGWMIDIQPTCVRGAHGFASVATPPFHGPNPLIITDSDNPMPGDRHAFAFVTKDGDWRKLSDNLNSYQSGEKVLADIHALVRGQGTLTIRRVKRTHTGSREPVPDRMDFDVVLSYPQD